MRGDTPVFVDSVSTTSFADSISPDGYLYQVLPVNLNGEEGNVALVSSESLVPD